MSLKRIELVCNIPDNVTQDELNQFLLFKYHGHSIDGDVLDKFKGDELDVDDFSIYDY